MAFAGSQRNFTPKTGILFLFLYSFGEINLAAYFPISLLFTAKIDILEDCKCTDFLDYSRGQIPITEDDFNIADDVVRNYDNVDVETDVNPNIIKYSKRYDDGTVVYVEEVRTGRKELALKTLYKKKNSSSLDEHLNQPSSHTPEASSSSTAISDSKDKSNYCCPVRVLSVLKNKGLNICVFSPNGVTLLLQQKSHHHEQKYKFYRTAGSISAIKIH